LKEAFDNLDEATKANIVTFLVAGFCMLLGGGLIWGFAGVILMLGIVLSLMVLLSEIERCRKN
jgi:preprotein translocase subunit SecD